LSYVFKRVGPLHHRAEYIAAAIGQALSPRADIPIAVVPDPRKRALVVIAGIAVAMLLVALA
jgi:hypothetical protein